MKKTVLDKSIYSQYWTFISESINTTFQSVYVAMKKLTLFLVLLVVFSVIFIAGCTQQHSVVISKPKPVITALPTLKIPALPTFSSQINPTYANLTNKTDQILMNLPEKTGKTVSNLTNKTEQKIVNLTEKLNKRL